MATPRIRAGLAVIGAVLCHAAAVAQTRPPLVFREDWTETPAATPVTQAHVANPDLILSLHGPGADLVKKSHHDQPADDPYYVWSGDTNAPWALSLRHRRGAIDLTGQARVRWRAKQSGFCELRLIVQLPDGPWAIAEQADGPSSDWRERDFIVADLTWRALDLTRVVEGRPIRKPDLSKVQAIGVTDLRGGGGTPASSRLDWIEVYGRIGR
jgi:hypothetical protein